MATSLNALTRAITGEYLESLSGKTITMHDIEVELLSKLRAAISLENIARLRDDKITMPRTLTVSQISMILLSQFTIRRISMTARKQDVSVEDDMTPSSYDLLGLYATTGGQRGTYVTHETYLRRVARQLHPGLSKQDFESLFAQLMDDAPQVQMTRDSHLVAVNNGVFDFNTKELLPFDPAMIFTTKSRVDYVPNAINPVITMPDGVDWDVVSWVNDLSDDKGVPELLWELLSSVVRPNIRWDKAAFFYSERGNNGKGTLCHLMRELVGEGSHTSIPIVDFGKDFMLEPLVHSSAVIVDENDVGTFIDRSGNFKAVVTGDVIQLNRKFKAPISLSFRGMVVQCVNAFPMTKDKSDSFARRQLFIPFRKNFAGIERKYIKSEYLGDKKVLQYVLWRVLHMTHTELSEPVACIELKREYREFNDPVRDFWAEFESQLVWDFVPFSYLHDLYMAWMKITNPGGKPIQRKRFTGDLVRLIVDHSSTWTCDDQAKVQRPGKRMDLAEKLTMEYSLDNWMSDTYFGAEWDQRAIPATKSVYRGIERA